MNKEKTTIQLLIEDIDSYVSKIPSSNVMGRVQRGLCGDIKRMAIESLKKEQEQIEKAFDAGYSDGIVDAVGLDKYKDANGKDYYKSKYGGVDHDRSNTSNIHINVDYTSVCRYNVAR